MYSDGLHGQLTDDHYFFIKNINSSYHQMDIWNPNFIYKCRFQGSIVNFGK